MCVLIFSYWSKLEEAFQVCHLHFTMYCVLKHAAVSSWSLFHLSRFLIREFLHHCSGQWTVTQQSYRSACPSCTLFWAHLYILHGFYHIFIMFIFTAKTGAIKFGDSLEYKECVKLVNSLSRCSLPFQCAHGRPSCMPLLFLDSLQTSCTQVSVNIVATKRYFATE